MFRPTRLFLATALCGTIALTSQSRAHAATLLPAPPPGAICQTTGTGTLCHGSETFNVTNAPTGISCGAFEVLATFSGTVTYELRYNAAGLGTEGTFHENVVGTYINSVTAKTITNNGHATVVDIFGTPGDQSTVTQTLNGLLGIATGRQFGLVGHDVGTITFDPNGNILFEGGPHNSIDDPAGFAQAVCTALS